MIDFPNTSDDTPATRNLKRLIDALQVVEAEFGFQVMRLKDHVSPRTDEEGSYHADLLSGYESSRYYTRVLRRYQEKRLERLLDGGPKDAVDVPKDIDVRGTAMAHIDDDETAG